jgi:uncharacterized protein YbjT (DUF2867 family)
VTHVLITGVRAKTGAPLAHLLADERDVHVRGGSTDPASVDMPGVTPVRFSWDDPTSWASAADGVDAMFVVRPDRPDAPRLISELIAGTPPHTHVVLLSELDGGYFGPDDWAPRVERAVLESGRTWTILRPGWFSQVFADERFMLDDIRSGTLPFPSGGQRIAWVDARDIAAVAARALLDPALRARTLDITGPEALTLAETASVLAAALGRPVEYVDLPMEQALVRREGFDRENDFGAYDRIRRGMVAVVDGTVQEVLGRPARTFAQFATDTFAGSSTPRHR